MLYYNSLKNAMPVIKALSAPMRCEILQLLAEEEDKNLNDLADILGLSKSAISLHIKTLEEAGLIQVQNKSGMHGTQKICKPADSTLMIDILPERKSQQSFYEDEIAIGHYSSCDIKPTCGIATKSAIIGEFDYPKYFLFPERFHAGILWFGYGSIEYLLPNRLVAGQKVTALSISFEISSECPGYNEDYPSDIYFYFNHISLGYWISPGDFGSRKGRFTSDWWPVFCNQYGLLKTLIINQNGTFIDGGNRISSITIDDLQLDYNSTFSFQFKVKKESVNCGGFTIFGRGFGDHNQGIIIKTYYNTEK